MIATNQDVRHRIYERDGGSCHICGNPVPFEAMHLDHVIPWSHGGTDTEENLRPSHPHCNQVKGSVHNGVSAKALEGSAPGWHVDSGKLKRARLNAALTIRELAERAGVGYLTVHRIEKGKVRDAYPSTLRKLAEALMMQPADLMSEREDRSDG